jgi:hypothetical protein
MLDKVGKKGKILAGTENYNGRWLCNGPGQIERLTVVQSRNRKIYENDIRFRAAEHELQFIGAIGNIHLEQATGKELPELLLWLSGAPADQKPQSGIDIAQYISG